jgi:hypothetical protein
VQKINQAKTGIYNQLWHLKGIGFREDNHEMFKWGQYEPKNAKSFYVA